MSRVLVHFAHKTEINLLLAGKFIDIFEAEAKKIEEAAGNSDTAGKFEFFLQQVPLGQTRVLVFDP
jgi:hypothetical protein